MKITCSYVVHAWWNVHAYERVHLMYTYLCMLLIERMNIHIHNSHWILAVIKITSNHGDKISNVNELFSNVWFCNVLFFYNNWKLLNFSRKLLELVNIYMTFISFSLIKDILHSNWLTFCSNWTASTQNPRKNILFSHNFFTQISQNALELMNI